MILTCDACEPPSRITIGASVDPATIIAAMCAHDTGHTGLTCMCTEGLSIHPPSDALVRA